MFGERTKGEVKRMVGKPFTFKIVALVCLVCLVHLVEPDKPHMLGAIGGEPFGEAMGQSDHAGRAIGWIEQHVQDVQAAGIG